MTEPRPRLLTEAETTLMQRGVSILVAASTVDRRTSVVHAVGCRVRQRPDASEVTVLLRPSHSPALLADIRRTAEVAVAFCLPSTHKTLQLKARDARLEPPQPEDRFLVQRQAQAFGDDIALLNEPAELGRQLFAGDDGDLVALVFTPLTVFDQTPGPKAGERLA